MIYLMISLLTLIISIIPIIIISIIILLIALCATVISLKWAIKLLHIKQEGRRKSIAFYHPYCNSRGGGERVLWTALRVLQQRYPSYDYYIYTGDSESPETILENVVDCFGIKLQVPNFIYLKCRRVLEASNYPVFTLLLQSLGSALLGLECLVRYKPDILIDSTGHAFIYPVFAYLGSCSVVTYTHYPTISTDMLQRVSSRLESHNNRRVIAQSNYLSHAKLVYYRLFASLYGFVGRFANVVMVNSSWTRDHIQKIWNCPEKLFIVAPPCDTMAFENLERQDDDSDLISIVSIGQFRPEKDYPLQLRIFEGLLRETEKQVELVLIGGVRNAEDEERVINLKKMADDLKISSKIRWKINATYSDLLTEVQNGTIGLHCMWNEHFGISVVECMAGGLIMLAHNSGGPKGDIVVDYDGKKTGFLADSEKSYIEQLKCILELSSQEKGDIRAAAKSSVKRFTEKEFNANFTKSISSIV